MKTLLQIIAAGARAEMRQHAMDYRRAIAPESQLTFSTRGVAGCEALQRAMAMRKIAQYVLLLDAMRNRMY